ncbi:unnamed protein product [marine sediment metagenome]|uniref:LamG-like jellyroll fold domain-containing protein n=1 Tax=marine sediment metagenome TaxID=412755 RepID=X0TIU8_9ZZZZ
MAMRFKTDGEMTLWVDGELRETNTSTVPLSLDRIIFNNSAAGNQPMQGLFNEFQYYDVALTDQQLIDLTT